MLVRTDHRPLIDRDDLSWMSDMILTSDAVTSGERSQLARAAADGTLRRLRPGVYTSAPESERPETRHRTLVRALSLTHPHITASHASAAALWRLPRLDRWPTSVEIAELAPSSRRSTRGITRRRTSLPFEPEVIEGIQVTGLDRATLDLIRSDSIASGVATADAALAGIRFIDGEVVHADREAMFAVLDSIPGQRGVEKARWVLGFADDRAELPGESLSRLQIHRLGMSPPVLGHCLEDGEGCMFPDFWWPEFGVAGEMDGRGKYLGVDAAFTRETVLREKRREDRMRRLCRGFVRWDWSVATNRPRLGALLRSAGVR